jgi:pullulanase-type alpha-1,6-glucosidase
MKLSARLIAILLLLIVMLAGLSWSAPTSLATPDQSPEGVSLASPPADHTPDPATVTIAGSLQSELGCPGDWQPECTATHLAYDAGDDVWQGTFSVPAGTWEYKAALNDSWEENYGAGGVLDGPNIPLILADPTDVKFYYDHKSHWITSNVHATIATVPGSFQDELGCSGDWQPDCLRSWLQDPDGDGTYSFSTSAIPAGDYEGKVAINESWDENYGAGGVQNGPNILFTVGANETVTFEYNPITHILTITTEPTPPPGPASVTIAGNLQDELGCPGDWQPECAITHLAYDWDDDVWQGTFTIPTGSWEYKAALNNSWDENYGANSQPGGANIPLSLGAETAIKFYYDHNSHWVTDNVNSVVATAAGNFQSELGCPEDWQPWCLRSWLQDIDGDGTYSFSTTAIPAGSYEFKIALDEAWDVSYPADNVTFDVPADGTFVTFSYDSGTNEVSVSVESGGLEPGDELLVRPVLQHPVQDQILYFTMPDRFANGNDSNNCGDYAGTCVENDTESNVLTHGYLPSDRGYYHGGDLAGLLSKLDYLENMGVTAIWVGPIFKNKPVQPDSSNLYGHSSAYHGYWILDFEQVDPHLGTNAEFKTLVDEAHARGIQIFMDIITNHTADVIQLEGNAGYRNKTDFPYTDVNDEPFDDSDFAYYGQEPWSFPPVDNSSFPYIPFVPAGEETVKNPSWLNNPLMYHNRGDSGFVGENSLYGDFFGLDDLWTERKEAVEGMIDIYKYWIQEFGVDGFRIDTTKHVNMEFWQKFGPDILTAAEAEGIGHFFAFGEVYDQQYGPSFLSEFSTRGQLQSTIDFAFQLAARDFASQGGATNNLRDFFEQDDYYIDADSNAYAQPTFLGNHDMGRIGYFLREDQTGADDTELLARSKLAHALMFFARGQPVIYYGDEQGFVGDGGDKLARQDMFPSQVPEYNDDDLIGTEATTADDNFDPTHPIYQALGDYAGLFNDHRALRYGAQIHRYSEGSAGIYAFSRIDRDEKIEYVVAFNNVTSSGNATFGTASPDTTFTQIYPTGGSLPLSSDAGGNLTVTVPGLEFVLYRADTPIPDSLVAPAIQISNLTSNQVVDLNVESQDGHRVVERLEVQAELGEDIYAEVTFAVSVDGGVYAPIGTDDNPPYRVFFPVHDLPAGTSLSFKAIVDDLSGNLNAAKVTGIVPNIVEPEPPPAAGTAYAVIHYYRETGDYGDHTTGDFNDFWGLHLWGDITETIDWTAPKPFLGEDDYGRFAWIRLAPEASNVGFIVHQGDTKDGTDQDRFFNPGATPEIWLKGGDATVYESQAEAQGYVTIHYRRPDGVYDGWGLHLWGDAIDPSESTSWDAPKMPDGIDDYGAFWEVQIVDALQPVNFIIHQGDEKDPGPDQSMIPAETASVWIMSGDETIYPQRGAAQNIATIHYHRADGDYGDYTSANYADFWGLHTWEGAEDPGWTTPRKPAGFDIFGPVFEVPLFEGMERVNYILHRGDEKDPGPDQSLVFDPWGYEVWQLEGEGPDPETPHYVLPILVEASGPIVGDITEQRAYWVDESTLAWDSAGETYQLHYAADGGLATTDSGITGGDYITLTPGTLSDTVKAKFPHLADLPALKIAEADLALVPDILKGQIAVSALDAGGNSVDATGLQIPGVLDDLYTYEGELGVTWTDDTPTIRLWAPTAKSVKLHLFDTSTSDPAAQVIDMTPGDKGTWSTTGDSSWKNRFYLFEVEVYVHATGQVERNMVTDPYSLSLAMNSTRSQIVDLSDAALKPDGWDGLEKPELDDPEDISIYEIHMRDFSASDPSVPDGLKGTYKAFTLADSNGVNHLEALAEAGLTHLHLLPVFDIATINENKAEWQAPDPAVLESYPPDSEQQQAAVSQTEDDDGFNWGYDPFHYTTPEGSYATNPDGSTRVVEFREMVQALNEDVGLRVVMDVVYNHTNAAGQAETSVLDRIVPGYYHRLNNEGQVETSTCCSNTATEHAMMEKLMIDSVVTWAKQYKIDAFRFDLMGHHSKANMLKLRAALDALTEASDGVNGSEIYLYGEGWNFGEVADNARFEQATQLNLGGTGIGTFSDRLRDAVRGGGPFDSGEDLIRRQGFANGLYYDPNDLNSGSPDELATLLLLSDQIRIGMAGNLAGYEFIDRNGNTVTGADVDYNGQPAGYTQDPQEDITYISKHDNQTLYDNNTYKTPVATSMADRVRIQAVGLSTVLLGQGVPFMHAGSDLLRSKSFDRDSFNSGDWFNKLDFTYQANNFGVGLPVAGKNQENWAIMRPLLANSALNPGSDSIVESTDLFQELLEIRYSSPLFRLQSADDVQSRVMFHNTGPDQIPGLIVMSLSDHIEPDMDEAYESIIVLINANDESQIKTVSELAGISLALHPVQMESVDDVVKTTSYDKTSGTFIIPGRTTAVFMEQEPRPVEVTFQVTVPTASPGPVHLAGSFPAPLPEWDSAGIELSPIDLSNVWTVTLTLLEGTEIEYKYTRGSWETVEKEADGNTEIANRILVVDYGEDGTQTVEDVVANWRDPIVVTVSPEDGAGDVSWDTIIVATWNQEMHDEVTFEVTGPEGMVSGSVAYDSDSQTTTFTPNALLFPEANYTARLADQVDVAGDSQQVPLGWSFTTISTGGQIEQIIGAVENLVNTETLNKGQGNSLMSKLDGALKKLDQEQSKPATNQLGAFINEVEAMIKSGKLTEEEGQSLIDAANAIIFQIDR